MKQEQRVNKRRVYRAVIGLGIWLLIGLTGEADVIRLRDGSVLKGRVVSFSQQKFTIVVKIGGAEAQYIVPADEVESVEFEDDAGGAVRSEQAQPRTGGADPLSRTVEPAAGRRSTTRSPAPVPSRESGSSGVAGGAVESSQRGGTGSTNTVIAEKMVTVAAAADWTSTEIRVQRGQRIVINASGEVDLGDGQRTNAAGKSGLADSRKLMTNKPTGGLMAVIGDDNNDYVYVGLSSEFPAPQSGIIFLRLNESTPHDNSGSFLAQVKILSNR